MILEAAHYAHGDAFQIEKRTVFAREWLPIAVKEQLAQPGQYVSGAAGGWPMLAVCGADGVPRAFRNTCRHRNMLLVDKDAGTCENFRCRFHGWTYGLDGALADAPPSVAPTGDKAGHGLTPMAMQPWRQVMLVNLQADTQPDTAAWDAAAGGAGAANVAHGHYAGVRMMDIACNWKTLLETSLPEDGVTWLWPAVLLRTNGDITFIDQIVPRTFLRTRVMRHAYVGTPHASGEAHRGLAALDALKSAAEQMQSARVQGTAADTSNARVTELHARLATAYARDTGVT